MNLFFARWCVAREAEIPAATLTQPGSPADRDGRGQGQPGQPPPPERAGAGRARPGACALRVSLALLGGGRSRASRRGIATRSGSRSGDRRSRRQRRHAPVRCPARRGRTLGKGSLPPPAGNGEAAGERGGRGGAWGTGGLGVGRCLESECVDHGPTVPALPQRRLDQLGLSSSGSRSGTCSVVSQDGCSLSLSCDLSHPWERSGSGWMGL